MGLCQLDTENLKMQVLKVFKHFDDDNSGYLDGAKIKSMLNECFFNLDESAISNMIAVADTDGDGKISEYEFLRVMKKVKLI
jgi:Ca2+-binding EF-hand superfamily protein